MDDQGRFYTLRRLASNAVINRRPNGAPVTRATIPELVELPKAVDKMLESRRRTTLNQEDRNCG